MTSPANAPNRPQGSTAGIPAGQAGTKKGGRGKPRVISGFTAEDLKIKRPKTVEEKSRYRRKREERSPIQKSVDGLVLEAYQGWIKLGRPRKFTNMDLVVWPVIPAKEDDARFMLQKGAQLIERTLRFGDCPTVDGKVELAFYVIDRDTQVSGAPDETEKAESESSDAGE